MDTKTLCLGALLLGDETGYDIKKRFEESFGYFLDVAPSGIYRALNDLEMTGSVNVTHVHQTGRPNKKVYTTTPNGIAAFEQALLETPARHRVRSELLFLLMFADRVPQWKIDDALSVHLGEMEALITETDEWLAGEGQQAPPGLQFVARFGLDMMRAHHASFERHADCLKETASAAPAAEPALAK